MKAQEIQGLWRARLEVDGRCMQVGYYLGEKDEVLEFVLEWRGLSQGITVEPVLAYKVNRSIIDRLKGIALKQKLLDDERKSILEGRA